MRTMLAPTPIMGLWLLAAACGGGVKYTAVHVPLESFYTPDDLEVKVPDVSGSWHLYFGVQEKAWLELRQEGDKVTVHIGGHKQDSSLRGRVLILGPGYGVAVFHPNGNSASLWDGIQIVVGTVPQKMTSSILVRHRTLPSAEHPTTMKKPALRGGMVVLLPVKSDGSVESEPYKHPGDDPFREVLAILYHGPRAGGGRAVPHLALRPLEGPAMTTLIDLEKLLEFHANKTRLPGSLSTLKMDDLRDARRAVTFDGSAINGLPSWLIMTPRWPSEESGVAAPGLEPAEVGFELHTVDPASGSAPRETGVVGKRGPDGQWTGLTVPLSTAPTSPPVMLFLEKGAPVRLQSATNYEPALEELLIIKEPDAAVARWRNRLLLAAKNRSVPKLLKEGGTKELKTLVERIEQLILDVNFEMERSNDQAQTMIQQGKPGSEEARNLALAYKERIEILKPILAALKEESANRDK